MNKRVPYINSNKEQLIGIGLELISQSVNSIAFIIFTVISENVINGVVYSDSALIERALKNNLPICLTLLLVVFPLFKYLAYMYKNKNIYILKDSMIDLLIKNKLRIQSNQFLNNFNMDINEVENVIDRIYPSLINSFLTSIFAIVLLIVDYDIRFVFILLITIIFNLIGGYFSLNNITLEEDINERKRIANSHILNIYSNNLLFSIYPNARMFLNKTIQILSEVTKKKDLQAKNNTIYIILFYTGFFVRIVSVVYIGVKHTDIGIGGITALLLLISQASMLFKDFSENLLSLKKYNIAKSKLNKTFLMDKTTKRADVNSDNVINIGKGIEFRNISFSYDSDDELFEDLSFRANSNELTLIKGDIGKGKSTILKLILKKFNASKGNIYIKGKSINTLDDSEINKIITYVDQGYKLFFGTVIENITMFNNIYDANTVDEVLKSVDLYDDIYSNELNIYSLVNRDGDNFSGGQKQRIAIARALYKNSEIILFDEPFSSLDKDNVDTLKEIIEYLSKTKTIIVVSHHNYLDDIADNIVQL